MSISADMLLTRSRSELLAESNQMLSDVRTSLLTIGGFGDKKKVDRSFRLPTPAMTGGHVLMLCWDDDERGSLKNGGNVRLSGDWSPQRYHTLLLMACPGGWWAEIARSANK